MRAGWQEAAAKAFAAEWEGKGEEKQDSQRFWMELLRKVYGVEDVENFVRFETRVKLEHTSFIDVMVPATHTMIEQKSRAKDLSAPIRQSDGTLLKPFEQAKRYAGALPYSERPRWIVACNFRQFQVFDMERPNDEPQIIELKDLGRDYYRLNFITDVRDSRITKELEVSKEAGAIIGRIYAALLPLYERALPDNLPLAYSYLNKLCVRLVFCFYAEDSGVFGRRGMFHDYLAGYKPEHFASELKDLFHVLDTPADERDLFLEANKAAFPYVNGSLFKEDVPIPPISEEVRRLILEDGCGFDWSGMSPVIFGSLFESCLNPETRRAGGMHYTSIENIHKVIDPLFLDGYREKFQQAMAIGQQKKRCAALEALQEELAAGQYFDPACGSGNFLTESYLSLRRLENDILRETITDRSGTGVLLTDQNPIRVSIRQFYGIEINDFAVSVAKTALWIAESQMMKETEGILRQDLNFLPLKTNANIHEGNALRMDWNAILPPAANVHLLGNPPFVGYSLQSKEQKADIKSIYVDEKGKPYKAAGKIDYVAGWYMKAAQYMVGVPLGHELEERACHGLELAAERPEGARIDSRNLPPIHAAFVSTNSITQGEQVAAVFEPLYERFGFHIDFAYQTFRWDSESADKAHVHCVIIGFSCGSESKEQRLYVGADAKIVEHINPYLLDVPVVFIKSRKHPICDVPEIVKGSSPVDGQNLLLSENEYTEVIQKDPELEKYIHPFLGAKEFLHNKKRFCFWLDRISPAEIKKHPILLDRIKKTREFRLASSKAATRKYADMPTRFMEIRQPKNNYILIPRHSSENRRYIPMDFLDPDIICGDANIAMPNAQIYHFGVLESNVHMAWMRTVCGRIKSDYRYSNDIVYNNFPWPTPTAAQRAAIERTAQGILDARALYPDSSLADLYDETTMPIELRRAHRTNDRAVLAAYYLPVTISEPDCVAHLMRLYQSLVS